MPDWTSPDAHVRVLLGDACERGQGTLAITDGMIAASVAEGSIDD